VAQRQEHFDRREQPRHLLPVYDKHDGRIMGATKICVVVSVEAVQGREESNWPYALQFRVSGSGFRILSFEFLASGFEMQVPFGLHFRVSGSGFQVPGSGFRVSGSVRDTLPDFRFRVSGFGF